MTTKDDNLLKQETPPTIEELSQNIRSKSEDIITFCIQGVETDFYRAEQSLRARLYLLACLYLELYLLSLHGRFDYAERLKSGLYYQGKSIPRTIKTIFGEVRYWRH